MSQQVIMQKINRRRPQVVKRLFTCLVLQPTPGKRNVRSVRRKIKVSPPRDAPGWSVAWKLPAPVEAFPWSEPAPSRSHSVYQHTTLWVASVGGTDRVQARYVCFSEVSEVGVHSEKIGAATRPANIAGQVAGLVESNLTTCGGTTAIKMV